MAGSDAIDLEKLIALDKAHLIHPVTVRPAKGLVVFG